jgi:hypothetical protein
MRFATANHLVGSFTNLYLARVVPSISLGQGSVVQPTASARSLRAIRHAAERERMRLLCPFHAGAAWWHLISWAYTSTVT